MEMRRTRIEHIESALPPLATEERTFGNGSSVPLADISVAFLETPSKNPCRINSGVSSIRVRSAHGDSLDRLVCTIE